MTFGTIFFVIYDMQSIDLHKSLMRLNKRINDIGKREFAEFLFLIKNKINIYISKYAD
jgi:hypothetical protein